MTEADVAFVVELCAARAGLAVDPDKPYLIESRLGPVARRAGHACVADLVAGLRAGAEEPLAWAVVEAMAVTEGGFFREPALLLQLWREVIPAIARRRPDGAVRVWCAGCGAGQEVYSLAMLQAEAPLDTGHVQLFASDLSERQLERARAGLYTHFEVQKGLSAQRLVRGFENREDQFLLVRRLRDQVRWRRVNLVEETVSPGGFDVVVCRQALGALTAPARARALANLVAALAPDGILLLGPEDRGAAEAGLAPMPGVTGAFVKAGEVAAAA